MMGPLVICDIRRKWRGQGLVTFWRPTNNGYCYPLSWAGHYSPEDVARELSYYAVKEGGRWQRFPVTLAFAMALAVPPSPGQIDGDAGPVVRNTRENRAKLVAARIHL